MIRRTLLPASFAALAVVGLAACSGGSTDTATDASSTTAAPAGSTAPATDPPGTTTTTAPTTTVFKPPPLPDPSPAISSPGDNHVYVLGDSVILGAKAEVPVQLKGWDVTFDAHESRFITQGLDILKGKKAQAEQLQALHQADVEKAYADAGKPAPKAPPKPTTPEAIGRVAVIHLCTNYQVGMGFANQIESYMTWLKDLDRVVWVTCAEWSPGQTEANQAIRDAAGRYPNVVVADWARYSPTPGYTYSDNIHLDGPGRQALAELVSRAVGPAPTPPPTTTTTLPKPTTTTTTAPPADAPA